MENKKLSDKQIEEEAKKLDEIIVNHLSNLEYYRKENIREFSELTEAASYLRSEVDKEKFLLFNGIFLIHFPDLKLLFKKNVPSFNLPNWFIATIIPLSDVELLSFFDSNSFKSSYDFHFDKSRAIAVILKNKQKWLKT